MPGFRRKPEADIQRIRQDLHDRYADGFAILKELLQNADDAGITEPGGTASRFVAILCPQGVPGARHPLLLSAGLCVLNDGAFTASDAESITSLGLSNKAGQVGAAGKFGLGLKSVFHWAEAFFYFSSETFTGEGAQQASAYDLLNPWASRENRDGRHQDWEDAWCRYRDRDCHAFAQLARRVLNAPRWFGLWIPLRTAAQAKDTLGTVEPIIKYYPKPELDDLFSADWRIRLAETLPLLRRVRHVVVLRHSTDTPDSFETIAEWQVTEQSRRLRAEFPDTWPEAPSEYPPDGQIVAGNGTAGVTFAGVEQLTPHPGLFQLRQHPNWPMQSEICPDGSTQQVREKAQPHGAVLFTRQPVDGKAVLRIQHAVFLPLEKSEELELAQASSHRYCLFLHGFFFVDAGRRHLLEDGALAEDFRASQAQSQTQVMQLWNRTLLREVVAPLVLPSVEAFARQEGLSFGELEALVQALERSQTLKPLKQWICKSQRYVPRLRKSGHAWEHQRWQDSPPTWVQLPKPSFPEAELFGLMPALADLCEQTTVSLKEQPCLANDKPVRLKESHLADLLQDLTNAAFEKARYLNYLAGLVREACKELETQSPLTQAMVRLANRLVSKSLPEEKNLGTAWSQFLKLLPDDAIVGLPLKSAEVCRDIAAALAGAELPVALLWQDFHNGEGKGAVLWESLRPVLRALGNLHLADAKAVQQRSKIAVRLLKASPEKPADWTTAITDLLLFASRTPGGQARAIGFGDLRQADADKRLFTDGEDWAKDLLKAAPGLQPLLIDPEVADAVELKASPCDAASCVGLLACAPRLAPDFTNRKPLFDRLLAQSEPADGETWKALRCLLHGQVGEWNNLAALLSEPHQADVFVRLANLALEAAGQSWRLIPHAVACQLALNETQHNALNFRDVSAKSVQELLSEVGPEKVDCASLTTGECDTILLQFNDVEVLRRLNIHETLDGRRTRITEHTYMDDGSFKELPEAFNALVTRIRNRTGYARFQAPDGSNRLVEKLNWEAVIRIALDQPQPADRWETILMALGQLGTPRAELRDRLRSVAWLPLTAGSPARPADLLHLPGAEVELDHLPAEILNPWIPILRLAEAVRKHERFGTFLKVVLPPAGEALTTLADRLQPHPAWSTGLTGEWSVEQVVEWVDALGDAPEEALLLARLVKALSKERETRERLPDFLERLGGRLVDAAYAGVLRHLTEKHRQAEEKKRPMLEAVFLRYLEAIDAGGVDFARRVLAREGVLLLNAAGQWQAPGELAWPTHGVQPSEQLSRPHADKLASLQQRSAAVQEAPQVIAQGESFDEAWRQTPKRLRDYFARWTDYVTRETIGAFLAILGDGEKGELKALAQEFLGQNTLEGIRDAIANLATQRSEKSLQEALAYHRFACVLHGEPTVKMPSVLGNPIDVRLGGERETLFLGSGVQAFPRAREWTERWLHLLRFDPAEEGGDADRLQGLLRASAEQILAWVFSQKGINLQPLWERLGQPAQLHIRIAQNRVVEVAPAFLRQVGAHHTPAIKRVLKDWDAADRRRAEAEENNRHVPAEVQQDLAQTKQSLRELLAQNNETQQTTLAAVRGKMEQYQYAPSSVPFELWQNTDDALVELVELGYDTSRSATLGCMVLAEEQTFALLHWGRLINEFQGTEGRNLRDRGFDQDLEKMVVQSVSDKGEAGQTGACVTGKFGLGFKSVFLVSDAPEVLSGSVDFVIRGGIYPVRLDAERREVLLHMLEELSPDHWRRGTVIHLPLRADGKANVAALLQLFERLAPLLVVFSRRLKRLRLRRDGGAEVKVHWQPNPVVDDVECGKLLWLDDWVSNALVLIGATGGDRVQFLLGLNSDGFVPLPEDVPVFWVTAPTRATSGYGFAVNGPFEPDVGRVQLALNSRRNEELADELARMLGERLKALWQLAQQDWEVLRGKLQLASSAKALVFWESLWEVLGRRFADKCPKSDNSPVATLARRILWQSENTGLRRFYGECEALPTGLWGEYQKLTRLGDIRFEAAGALDRENVFRVASQWPAFRERVQQTQLVSGNRVASVLRRLKSLAGQPETIHLAKVVDWELTQGQERRADPEAAGRLGQLVTPDFLRALKEGEPAEREEQEHKALSELLPKVLFQVADGSWRKSAELVVANGEGVEKDEQMRAAFAPSVAQLNPAYTGKALAFFLACRDRLSADVATLAEWVLQAGNESTRVAALRYLLDGELRDRLADVLRRQRSDQKWLWQLDRCEWFTAHFKPEEQHQFRTYVLQQFDEVFRRQTMLPQIPPQGSPEEDEEAWTVRKLWDWWERQGKPVGDYVLEGEANWPLFHDQPIPGDEQRRAELKRLLLAAETPEGKELWYRLFGYACLVSARRRMTELRQFWRQRLKPAGFWARTSDGDFSEESREIFEQAMTAKNSLGADSEQAYFWRRVFYDIRKVHRMVQNDFPAVLLELIQQGHGEHLPQFLRTGHLPGPDQRRWIGTFGQSAGAPIFFVVRELCRLGIVPGEALANLRPLAFFACTPVRRAAARIRWIDAALAARTDFESLAEVSRQLHERISSDRSIDDAARQQLLDLYDIPLLHLGLTELRA